MKKTAWKRTRDIASWVFSLALVFSMTPVAAFAAPDDGITMDEPVVEQVVDEAVDVEGGEAVPMAEEDSGSAADETQPADVDVEDEGVDGAQQADPQAEGADDAPQAGDATGDEASADFAEKDGTEAADVQGEAAEDEEVATEALEELDGVDAAKAEEVAGELIEPEGFTLLADDEDDPDGDGIPRQGDGSYIEGISAKWITADTVDNGDPALLYVKPSDDNDQSVRLQINYALSGEHDYEPGDITITVPAHIFKKRGSTTGDYGDMIIPYPEDPSTRNDFNWKLVGDNYILTNTKRMSAATKGYIQFGIDGLTPHVLFDMGITEPFDAFIEVVTHKGNTIDLRSNELTAQIDTDAEVTSASKRVYGSVERVPASSIPESQRIEGETEYIKVNWYSWYTSKANTLYSVQAIDTIPDEYNGFIIGATSDDGRQLSRTITNSSYANGQSNYHYFSTAYPASQFEKDTDYVFHNGVTYTLTEQDDPNRVTSKSASAQTVWNFRDPEWTNPTGHFMVVKNGNDDKYQYGKSKYNYTHHKNYGTSSYSDNHLWSHSPSSGWYGIYPSALNHLRDEHDAGGSVQLSYTVDSVGYVMPWMFQAPDNWWQEVVYNPKTGRYELVAEPTDETETVPCTRIAQNYIRPVTMVTEDKGISIGRNTSKLELGTDYTFASVEFPSAMWVYTGAPQNINEDGSWEALDAGDGTFKYTRDESTSHWPDIKLEIQRGGEWEHWATASYKTGSLVVRLADGSRGDAVVSVPEDTQNYRTTVTLQNDPSKADGNVALQAAIDYDMRVVVNLKSTDDIVSLIEEGFSKSPTPELDIWNEANMVAERTDVAEGAADREIVSIDNDGRDLLRGYTTDIGVYPYKTSRQSYRDVDYENRTITIHYTAKVEERSVINDKSTYEHAVEENPNMAERHGIWRDLLPKGVTPDLTTIDLMPTTDAWNDSNYVQRTDDRVTHAYTIEDYEGTGRTMLVVEVDLTPTPQRYRSGDMYYYEDVPRIAFDAKLDFESLKDYGDNVHNVISFESSNDEMGTIPGFTGEPDDPNGGNNQASSNAFENNAEKTAMTNLNPDRDTPSFVYAGRYTKIDIISAARTSLSKDVQVNNDGWWSDGLYYGEKEANQRIVYEGGQYSYRLRMMSDDETISKDLILYDSLENFQADDGNDTIDIHAPHWRGTFRGVDTSQLEAMGCAPVVYYSEVPDLQLADESNPDAGNTVNMDLTNGSIWTEASVYEAAHGGDLSGVKAIAIDASKKADGSDFELQPLESTVVIVNMLAPSGDEAREYLSDEAKGIWGDSAQAYNNAYLLCTSIDTETMDEDSDNFIRKDYTKVGLMEYNYEVTKAWSDDNDRDGIRPDSVTLGLYAGAEPALDGSGNPITLVLPVVDPETGAESWTGVFEHIPYTDPDGNKINYSVREVGEMTGYSPNVQITGPESTTITNFHEPELISVSGTKAWVGDEGNEEARPTSVAVQLYADGKLAKTVTVKPDAEGNWNYTFDNLYKYRNHGTPIEYTVQEVQQTSGPGASYTVFDPPINNIIVNVYHPYGDLEVSKSIVDATSVSEPQEFEFTFTFTRESASGEDEPVFDEYAYQVLDESDEVIDEGMVATGDSIAIKGGQRIHVAEIGEYVKYTVTESRYDGWTLTRSSNAEGTIVPNQTQEASFTNTYAARGQVNLLAQKTLLGHDLQRYQFRFELYQVNDDGTETLVRTASNARPTGNPETLDDGNIQSTALATFGALRYTQEDAGKTFNYVIRETDSGKPGYTYDGSEHTVTVTVTDNGDGTLEVVPVYDGDESVESAAFQNSYQASGDLVLRAWKDLQGRTLDADKFEFELFDADGNVLQTKKNTADGSVVFDAIHYDQTDIGKTYYYGVREVEGDDQTVVYDDSVFGYSVEVFDNGDGTLSFNQGFATPLYGPSECEVCHGENSKGFVNLGNIGVYGTGSIPAQIITLTTDILTSVDITYPYDNPGEVEVDLQDHPDLIDKFNQLMDVVKFVNENGYHYELIETEGNLGPFDENYKFYLTVENQGYPSVYMRYVCSRCNGEELDPSIIGWDAEEGELPVFENTLKSGGLSITKLTEDAEDADPNQEFKFKVKLIGEGIEDGEMSYDVSAAGEGSAQVPGAGDEVADPNGESPDAGDENPDAISEGSNAGTVQPLSEGDSAVPDEDDAPAPSATRDKRSNDPGEAAAADRAEGLSAAYAANVANAGSAPDSVSLMGESEGEVTVTYNANGGSFADGTTNVVSYQIAEGNPIYDHSSNWLDDGTSSGSYYSNTSYFSKEPTVHTIPGASSLDVHVVFSSPPAYSTYYCYIIPGEYTNRVSYQADVSSLPAGSVRIGPTDGLIEASDHVIDGDTVSIVVFDQNGSQGHFITIASSDALQSGTYQTPEPASSDKKFVSWNTQANGFGSSYYGDVIPQESMTLYAQYEDDGIIASGVFRNVYWRIEQDGSLIIGREGEDMTFAPVDDEITTSWHYPWTTYGDTIKSISFEGTVHGDENMSYMFGGWYDECATVDMHGFDSSAVKKMDWFFAGLGYDYTWEESGPSVTLLHLDEMDVSNVTTMERMFEEVGAVSIDLSSWDVSNVENFDDMFLDCARLQSLDMSGWDTSSATSMYRMVGWCTSLSDLKGYEDFDTSNVTDLAAFFMGDESLPSIDVSKWDTGRNTDFSSMFEECKLVKNLDVGHFNVSNGTDFGYMFCDCTNLESIDTSHWMTGRVNYLSYFVSGCPKVEEIDMSGFDCEDAVNHEYGWAVENIFDGSNALKRVVLPDSFRFIPANNRYGYTSILPTPSSEYPYSGLWVREDREYGPMTAQELQTSFNADMWGVWIWDKDTTEYTIKFTADGAAGSMAPVLADSLEDFTLPANKFVKHGYAFDHWEDEDGNVYNDKAVIPARTYEKNAVVTLTAVFTESNTTVNIKDGEFELILHGDETATFSDLPAGTSYQVWEETPDGWILIEQSNVSGNIEPLETADARFTNRYQPGAATAQFSGTKTLDGQAAAAGAYSFELNETTEGASGKATMLVNGEEKEVNLPYTVATTDGGFVQFPVIVYSVDDVGTHTYTITEVDPSDATIDCDAHAEVVTVVVSGDINELSAETTIDEDGDGRIAFANKTRPGELRLTKIGNGSSPANADDVFTFKVTFTNAKGLPLGNGDKISWLVLDSSGNVVEPPAAPEPEPQPAPEPEEPEGGVTTMGKTEAVDSAEPPLSLEAQVMGAAKRAASARVAEGAETGAAEAAAPGDGAFSPMAASEPFHATEDQLVGDAYALLVTTGSNAGELIFFRSEDELTVQSEQRERKRYNDNGREMTPYRYTANIAQTVTINGEEYTGYLFANVENTQFTSGSYYNTDKQWAASDIKSVRVADGYAIQPKSMAYWFSSLAYDLNSSIDAWSMLNGEFEGNLWSAEPLSRNSTMTSFDATGFDTSQCTSFSSMFRGCLNLTGLDLSSFDTSSATTMYRMFYMYHWNSLTAASKLAELNVSNFDTSSVTNMNQMFYGCENLKVLDLSSFDTQNATMTNAFAGNTTPDMPEKVILGPDFRFNSGSTIACGGTDPYTGNWTREDGVLESGFNPTEWATEYNLDPDGLAGVWVWELPHDKGLVKFDANGGSITSTAQVTVTSADQSITMPNESTTVRPHYELTGWNTEPDGSGTAYDAGVSYTTVAELGKVVTLYAQWTTSNLRNYRVVIWVPSRYGHEQYSNKTYQGDSGTEVTPELEDFEGLVTPEPQTQVIADDDSTVFTFWYEREHYTIKFDGNGATAGQTPQPMTVEGPYRYNSTSWSYPTYYLPANTFRKDGALFNGWNTEPDGSGKSYTDQERFTVRDTQPLETVTLYAQWLEGSNEDLEPTAGEVYVTCRAGDTIVFPTLPAGTNYTIEEVGVPDGWIQTGSVGDTGTIVANGSQSASVTNDYSATGAAVIVAHKLVPDQTLSGGEFTFELLDSPYYGNVLQTTTNGATDTEEFVYDDEGNVVVDEDGNEVANRWNGTAPVVFDEITFDRPGYYYFYIREVANEDGAYAYDEHFEFVQVYVSDAGHGQLKTEVVYDDVSFYDGDGPIFTNLPNPASLTISKEIEDAPDSVRDTEFEFIVELQDAEGNPISGEFAAKRHLLDEYSPAKSETKVSHTPNVADDGTKLEEYGNNLNMTDVVTLDGAENLTVTINWGCENEWDWYYDWAIMWEGAHPEYNPNNSTDINQSLTYRLCGGSQSDPYSTRTYEVEGDSVTFGFHSDGGYAGDDGYGYYATVTGITQQESGYAELTVKSGDTVTLKGGEELVIDGLPAGVTYTVTEVEKADWELVSTEGESGTLDAGGTAEAMFTNKYEPQEIYSPIEPPSAATTVTFSALKTLDGRAIGLTDNFTFELIDDATGQTIQTRGTDSFGGTESTITFEPVTITNEGLSYDEAAIDAYIDKAVADKRSEHEESGSELDFEDWLLEETGMSLSDFIEQADADAYIALPRQKTVTYTVREVAGDTEGVTYDSNSYVYKVVVTEVSADTISTDVTMWKLGETEECDAELDEVVFANAYEEPGVEPEPVQVTLAATKTLDGAAPGDKSFSFTLTGTSENAQDTSLTATNDTEGNVEFAAIEYDVEGVYTYEIAEAAGDDDSIVYDDAKVEVTVTVTRNDDNELEAAVAYDGSENPPAFANTTKEEPPATEPIEVALEATKTLDGAAPGEAEFTFTLTGTSENAQDTSLTATNDADGKVEFAAIEYSEEGVYEYEIAEAAGTDETIKYDAAKHTAKVTVTKNEDGLLEAAVSYDDSKTPPAFANETIPPEPETVSITVTKAWDDGNDADGIRPASVTISLLANGEETGETLELSEANEWTAAFTGLPKEGEDGTEIAYSVLEAQVPGYDEPVYTGDAENGFTVTNPHEPQNPDEPDNPDNPDNPTPPSGDGSKTPTPSNQSGTQGTTVKGALAKTGDTEGLAALALVLAASATLGAAFAVRRRRDGE